MEDLLSRCTLTDIKEQYKCKFFVKASKSALNQEQCSHYRSDFDNHCDNVNAQMAAAGEIMTKEKDIKPDFSY
jgi:homoserine kinase